MSVLFWQRPGEWETRGGVVVSRPVKILLENTVCASYGLCGLVQFFKEFTGRPLVSCAPWVVALRSACPKLRWTFFLVFSWTGNWFLRFFEAPRFWGPVQSHHSHMAVDEPDQRLRHLFLDHILDCYCWCLYFFFSEYNAICYIFCPM